MASVRDIYASTVDRHFSITGILIAASIALAVGIVIGMLLAGAGSSILGTSAFGFFAGDTTVVGELRQGGR